MLNNIRKRINSVIQEGIALPEQLSPSYIRQKTSLANETDLFKLAAASDPPLPSTINIQAGCKLLEQQTEPWTEIHTLNEENAAEAMAIDTMIERLQVNSSRMLSEMNDLNSLVASVPSILSTLQLCGESAKQIKQNCKIVNEQLFRLEDLIETMELQGQQLDHQYEMAMYKDKKLTELDLVRKELVDRHSANCREYERRIKSAQQERQAVFQEAFQNDLQFYKESGSIPSECIMN